MATTARRWSRPFPTYRARGAIRELGKALGLPPGEIERVARGSEGWDAREVGSDIETALAADPESVRSGRPPGASRGRPGAGRGWRGWQQRRTGSRVICPSTPAG